MSTVTVHIIQNVTITRTTPTDDPADVAVAVAGIVNNELVSATGLDWSTLAVTVDSGSGAAPTP